MPPSFHLFSTREYTTHEPLSESSRAQKRVEEPVSISNLLSFSSLSNTAMSVVGFGGVGAVCSFVIESIASRYGVGKQMTNLFSMFADELGTGTLLSQLGNGTIGKNLVQSLTSRAVIHGLMMVGMGIMLPLPLQMLMTLGSMTAGNQIAEWLDYQMGISSQNPFEDISLEKIEAGLLSTALGIGVSHLIPVNKLIGMMGKPLSMASAEGGRTHVYYAPSTRINDLDMNRGYNHSPLPIGDIYKLEYLESYFSDLQLYQGASPVLARLLASAKQKEVQIKIVEGTGMFYEPATKLIHIGGKHRDWANPSSFLIHISHELAHADDELMDCVATSLTSHLNYALYAEAYAIERQLRVAAQFHQDNLHPGFEIEMGTRTLRSQTYLVEYDKNPEEMNEYIRQWVLEVPLLMTGQHGVGKSSYREQYESNYTGPDNNLNHDLILAQQEMVSRARAALPHAGFDNDFQDRIDYMMARAERGEVDAAEIADVLLAYQMKNSVPPYKGMAIEKMTMNDLRNWQSSNVNFDGALFDRVLRTLTLKNRPPESFDIYRIEIDTKKGNHRIYPHNLRPFKEIQETVGGRIKFFEEKSPPGSYRFPQGSYVLYLPSSSFIEEMLRDAYPIPCPNFLYCFGQPDVAPRFFQEMRGKGIMTISHPFT